MESYREDREAGSIGIGAMIVFIALILVAAVASTIIIKTAEELQQNAEQTSSDTRQQISGKVSIVDVIAASTGTDITGTTNIATFDVIFRISSGSTGIYPADISYYVTCEISASLGMAVALISQGPEHRSSHRIYHGAYCRYHVLRNSDSWVY